MPFFSSRLGSSSSDSSGGLGEAAGLGVADCEVGRRGTGAGRDSSKLPSETGVSEGTSGAFTGSGAGVSSMSECVPVVQGGMARNSSKVRTRGLQHFQPGWVGLRQHWVRREVWVVRRRRVVYLFAPRERRADRGGRRTPRCRLGTSSGSLCARTFSPWLLPPREQCYASEQGRRSK